MPLVYVFGVWGLRLWGWGEHFVIGVLSQDHAANLLLLTFTLLFRQVYSCQFIQFLRVIQLDFCSLTKKFLSFHNHRTLTFHLLFQTFQLLVEF